MKSSNYSKRIYKPIISLYDMPISKSETVPTKVDKLRKRYLRLRDVVFTSEKSSSLFFTMHNVFKNRTIFSILLWLCEHEEGLTVEDVIAGFNLSRASAFRYCRMLADVKVVERTWDVEQKDDRAYAKNRFVINKYGKGLIGALFSLEKGTQS